MKKKLLISSSILFFLPLALTLLQSCICGGKSDKYFEITKLYLETLHYKAPYQYELTSVRDISFWVKGEIRYYSFMNHENAGFSLMACSPKEPVMKETITNIEIFSDKDFEGFSAGTNLAPLLGIETPYEGGGRRNLTEYLATKPKSQKSFYLYFSQQAQPTSGLHLFKIVYTDSKNRVFEMNTHFIHFR